MSTKLFTTVSGSLYELDSAQRRIRFVSGTSRSRHLAPGTWASYDAITALRVGVPVFIVWPDASSLSAGHIACTTTSYVTEVVEKGHLQ